jgi:hypothetical protein
MKSFMIILAIALAVFILFQSYMVVSTNSTEIQPYTVVKKEDGFEIRFYPATTMATVQSSAKTYRDLSGPGFRKLAGFIFGSNDKNTKIAMTSPVHMDINNSASSMSFVMPKGYDSTNLPHPKDPSVKIELSENEYVAAIGFGGFASENKIKIYEEKLKELLLKKEIKTIGNFRYLGYNPPYQLLGRRNEIIISINWK